MSKRSQRTPILPRHMLPGDIHSPDTDLRRWRHLLHCHHGHKQLPNHERLMGHSSKNKLDNQLNHQSKAWYFYCLQASSRTNGNGKWSGRKLTDFSQHGKCDSVHLLDGPLFADSFGGVGYCHLKNTQNRHLRNDCSDLCIDRCWYCWRNCVRSALIKHILRTLWTNLGHFD